MLILFVIVLFAGIVFFLFQNHKKHENNSFNDVSSPSPTSSVSSDSLVWDTGKTGERYTKETLAPLFGYKKILSNCYIPKPDGTFTEIDLILLHESGIYVIESKNYSGWIFGSETQQQWTQSLPSGKGRSTKVRFLNPIIQNKVHLKWLKKYIDSVGDIPFFSCIVFSDRCELKEINLSTNHHFVVNRRNLLHQIQKTADTVGSHLSVSEIDELYDKLYPLTQVSEEQKALHVQEVEKKKQSFISPKTTKGICPRCGGKLVLLTAKRGDFAGQHFWGCSNYPRCRFVESIKDTAETVIQ